ncbi:MAG: hypothetical protein ACE5G8_00845 [Anaerolineae bacterium]
MANKKASHTIILSESEFDFIQEMLDHGSATEEALLAVRPDLKGLPHNIEDSVLIVRRRSTANASGNADRRSGFLGRGIAFGKAANGCL